MLNEEGGEKRRHTHELETVRERLQEAVHADGKVQQKKLERAKTPKTDTIC